MMHQDKVGSSSPSAAGMIDTSLQLLSQEVIDLVDRATSVHSRLLGGDNTLTNSPPKLNEATPVDGKSLLAEIDHRIRMNIGRVREVGDIIDSISNSLAKKGVKMKLRIRLVIAALLGLIATMGASAPESFTYCYLYYQWVWYLGGGWIKIGPIPICLN